jgi:HSP20 family protein
MTLMTPFIVSMLRDASASLAGRLDVAPAVDAYRRDDRLVLHVDLPGVSLDSLDVQVNANTLTITAERTYAPEPGDRVLLSERPFGRFERRFRLADPVEAAGVTAELSDGVLTVTLPAATASSSRVTVTRPVPVTGEEK